MEFLTENIKNQIKLHALQEFPKECCGYIILNEPEIIRAKNISDNPEERFEIDLKSYLKTEGKPKISYHSHKDNSDFSEHDKLISEGHKIYMLIYCIKNDTFNFYEPKGYSNRYTGKSFKIGERDCLSLLQEYYKNELGISLKDYPRNYEWLDNPRDDYETEYANGGYRKVSDLKKNDLILFKFPNYKFASHVGIYLGDDCFLHHQRDCLSNIEKYSNLYKKITYCYLRHELFE